MSSPRAFVFAYHQRSAPIKAAMAVTALKIKSSTSSVVGFFFFRFIVSPPLLYILYHFGGSLSIVSKEKIVNDL